MNREQPQIINPELAAEALLENEATKRASAHPLPGPLRDAFCSGPITVAGKTIYKVVPRTFQALVAIDSPMIKTIQDVVQTGKVDTEFTEEQAWEICWIFTHEPKAVREMLDKGVAALKEAAVNEVGESWDAAAVNMVIAGCLEQIKRHMLTSVKFAAEAQEKGEITFFRDLATPPKTAAAGS